MEPGEDHLFAEAVQTGLDGDSSRAQHLLGWLRRKRGSWRVWMCMRMRLWRRRRRFSFMGWSIDLCTVMYHWDGRFYSIFLVVRCASHSEPRSLAHFLALLAISLRIPFFWSLIS